MKILLVGGGSGGHITPLLALAKDLKKRLPELSVCLVSERGGKFTHIIRGSESIDNTYQISAGKLRRYHNESWSVRVFDVKRNLLNLRDLFRMIAGLIQSLWLLIRKRPDVIFVKGGYVGVPVGFAARLLRIPYITHDSDALAGLTNRLIASHAKLNAVGMPESYYSYDKNKIKFVGVPVGEDFTPVSPEAMAKSRKELGLPLKGSILLITGGSNGAQRVDTAVSKIVPDLLKMHSDLFVIHQVGQGNEDIYEQLPSDLIDRILVKTFLKPLSSYSAAADVIIARAGATAIAEFAAQKKPCIIIPNPVLTGGHQLKNAEALDKANAAIIVDEDSMIKSEFLTDTINGLLVDDDRKSKLAVNLHGLIPSDGTKRISNLIVDVLTGRTSD